jgi:mono/diheme cytochrome c family protein
VSPTARGRAMRGTVALLAAALLLTACGRNMADQPKVKPFQASGFFEDGAGMRLPPAETVPREFGGLDEAYLTGLSDGDFLTDLPVPVTLELLRRGQQRFDVYCSPCHDYDGRGTGAVVRRGFPHPPSFVDEPRLLAAPVGYIFNAITYGSGRMFSYASRVSVEDRWAISAYVKALQLSQNADPADIPEGAQVILPTVEAAR